MGVANTKQLKLDAGGEGSVAKAKPVKLGMQDPQSPSTLHVYMDQHDIGDVSVGKLHKFEVHAKAVSHNKDEYSHSARFEVQKIVPLHKK